MTFNAATMLLLFTVTVVGECGLQNRMSSMEDGVEILVTWRHVSALIGRLVAVHRGEDRSPAHEQNC